MQLKGKSGIPSRSVKKRDGNIISNTNISKEKGQFLSMSIGLYLDFWAVTV